MRAALETGCRYSELARLEVYDFNFDPGTVAIRKSKGGKPGHVILTPEGAEFFQHHCAGRTGSDLMFRHADGSRWNTSEQSRPSVRTRHDHAAGFVPHPASQLGIARGHGGRAAPGGGREPRPRRHPNVEKHYGHLAPSYIADAIRAWRSTVW